MRAAPVSCGDPRKFFLPRLSKKAEPPSQDQLDAAGLCDLVRPRNRLKALKGRR